MFGFSPLRFRLISFFDLQEVRAGFTWGEVTISRLRDDEVEDTGSSSTFDDFSTAAGEEDLMIIPFQNENLAAYIQKPDGSRRVAAIVPDLITLLDSQNGSHLGTQVYTYGLRVTGKIMLVDPTEYG